MKPELKYFEGTNVRLTNDLTKYHKSLIIGIIGITRGSNGMWSRNQPERFVSVRFPEITLDVMWKGLEVVL